MDGAGSRAWRLHCRMACIRTEADGLRNVEIVIEIRFFVSG